MIKGIRIGEDLNSFLTEHPEIKIHQTDGKITYISIPDEAIVHSLFIKDRILYDLEYTYKGNHHHYYTK